MTDVLDLLTLAHGSHNDPHDGVCFNEALAYLAGEWHSDAPLCVSPVIRRFTMRLNDRLDDERRTGCGLHLELREGGTRLTGNAAQLASRVGRSSASTIR